MQKLLIKGKKELSGTISISGSKNATLPILAATILAHDVKLFNVPLVKDIFTMLDLLKFIGIKVKVENNKSYLALNEVVIHSGTIAQLIECILGKSCALIGAHGDGTPFMDTNVHDIADILEGQGFESYGNEVLYNGFNGRQMETR